MNNDEICYTTVEQQIEKLKQQNLIIDDKVFAKEALTLFGYSNLIKSYREPYVIFSNDKKYIVPVSLLSNYFLCILLTKIFATQ